MKMTPHSDLPGGDPSKGEFHCGGINSRITSLSLYYSRLSGLRGEDFSPRLVPDRNVQPFAAFFFLFFFLSARLCIYSGIKRDLEMILCKFAEQAA